MVYGASDWYLSRARVLRTARICSDQTRPERVAILPSFILPGRTENIAIVPHGTLIQTQKTELEKISHLAGA